MKFLVLLALLGCAAAQPAPRTIIDTLQEMEQTSILGLIEAAGLTEALSGDGPFTAFVPKQEVLDALPQEILDALLGDIDLLTKGLTYHVADGQYLSEEGVNEGLIPTLQGTPLRLNIYDDVDGVPVATVAGVPIDLNQIDIEAGNGYINFLDGIILDVPDWDVVGTVQNAPDELGTFEAIIYAVESLGLTADLQADQDITVMAPFDSDLFNVDIVDELLADPDGLAAILNNHIAMGTWYSAGIGSSREITTLGGNTVVIAFTEDLEYAVLDTDGNLLGDLTAGDIPTTQGVLHILDRPIILG